MTTKIEVGGKWYRGSEKKKSSIVVKFTRICIIITAVTALVLSTVFIINARNILLQQVTTHTEESVGALRNELLSYFGEWEALVRFSAAGVASMMAEGYFSEQALQRLLARNFEMQPNVNILYATSNARWDGSDGFAAFHNNWTPPAGWDNTERPWFLAAKANPGRGRAGYTEPFLDAMTQNMIISVVTNIYDDFGRDVGVVSTDVSLAFLSVLLGEKTIMAGHAIGLVDRQGDMIAHSDPGVTLGGDFFGVFGFEHYRSRALGAAEPFTSRGRDILMHSEIIPGVGWVLVSTLPVSAVFSEVNVFIRNMIFVVLALLAAALFVSMWFTRKELAVPIRSIMSAAGSIADMDYTVGIKVTENDELGDMQEAMVKIRDNLKKNQEDIRREQEIQKKKEEAEKERMQAILDASPMLCGVYDEEGNALEVNKEAENLFGIPDKRIFITQFNDFLPPRQPDGSDSMQKNVEMFRQTIRDGHSRYEWMYKHRDGTPLPTEEIMQCIKIDGKTRVIAYARDLREFYASKEAEQAAQKRVNEMMERLNNQLETQSSAITESSAAIEEMIANIRSVSNTLSKNSENVNDLHEASEVGHAGLNEVASDIKEIAKESESLLEINAVMQNIASQTNLLSMNAAIEAAHAGDSGRGFAVVADEIRKLAESSSQQSKTISAVLKNIKGSIDKITKSTGNVMEKFDAIDSGVKTVVQQEQGIMNAMTEQGAGSTQIMQAIAQVNDITYQVKADARQMVEAAAKLGA